MDVDWRYNILAVCVVCFRKNLRTQCSVVAICTTCLCVKQWSIYNTVCSFGLKLITIYNYNIYYKYRFPTSTGCHC